MIFMEIGHRLTLDCIGGSERGLKLIPLASMGDLPSQNHPKAFIMIFRYFVMIKKKKKIDDKCV